MNVHKNSPLGRATAAAAALEAQRDQAAQLADRRRAELGKAQEDLQAIPADVKDLREVMGIQARQAALAYLLGVAEGVAKQRAEALDQIVTRITDLQRRVERITEGVDTLADRSKSVPWSPIQRAEKLAIARCKLAMLIGDPDEVSQLIQEAKRETDPSRWPDVRLELEGHTRDVEMLANAVAWYRVRTRAGHQPSTVTVGGQVFNKHGVLLREADLTSEIRRSSALELLPVEELQD